MSSATQSNRTTLPSDGENTAPAVADRLVSGVRATAFWTAALLPIALLAALAVGAAGRAPAVFAGAMAVNALCAVAGHGHSPK